jgi:hypothetical protein
MIGRSAPAESSRRTNCVHIVLIEDDTADVYLLEKALRARNIAYELTRFEDGEQAVCALANDGGLVPDLILSISICREGTALRCCELSAAGQVWSASQ